MTHLSGTQLICALACCILMVRLQEASTIFCGNLGMVCEGHAIACDPVDENCIVYCQGADSCLATTLQCPKNAHCEVQCSGDRACKQMEVTATESSSFTLRCSTSNNFQQDACSLSKLYCPDNGHLGEIACNIYGASTSVMSAGIDIYAVEGFNDLNIDGDTVDPDSVTVFCGQSYERSCSVSYPAFVCAACNNIRSPSQFPTQSPSATTMSPSSNPTASPSTHPSVSPTSSTENPSVPPTNSPTLLPSKSPSNPPTKHPTVSPTALPTPSPVLSIGEQTTTTTATITTTSSVVEDNDDQGDNDNANGTGDGLESGVAANSSSNTQNAIILIVCAVVLLLCCGVVGFVVIYKWKRMSEKQPQQTEQQISSVSTGAKLVRPETDEQGVVHIQMSNESKQNTTKVLHNRLETDLPDLPAATPQDRTTALHNRLETDLPDLPDARSMEDEQPEASISDDFYRRDLPRETSRGDDAVVQDMGTADEVLSADGDHDEDDEKADEIVMDTNRPTAGGGPTPFAPPEKSVSLSSSSMQMDQGMMVTPMGLTSD